MMTNQYALAGRLQDMLFEVEQMRVRTGYYDRDTALEEALSTVAGALDEAIDAFNYADEFERPYSDVDPCEAAKAEAELKMFLATC
jgi:hypothetical protein